MTAEFKLISHQKHPHLSFAFVDGDHKSDFAMHRHDFSEMFLVTGGKGTHKVASYQYPLQVGDVFIINGDTEHGFENVEELTLINLMFDDQNPFFELPTMRKLPGYQALFKIEPWARQTTEYRAKLTLNPKQTEQVMNLLCQIKEEYEYAQPGFEIMISGAMQQLIVMLSRSYQQQQEEFPTTTLALGRALVFLEQNFSDPELTSEQIARHAFISKRQLERLFRQFFNTSPNKYLRDLQLKHAKILLSTEQKSSIQEIAEMSGFSDGGYFSKCFKEKFGMTPKQVKKG